MVLYSKNHWRLTGVLPASNIFTSYPQLFRQVTFIFNNSNISPALKHHIEKMYSSGDHTSEEFKATDEQCLRESLHVPQWSQLLRALIPHLDVVSLDTRELRNLHTGGKLEVCWKGSMYYEHYLTCLIFTETRKQGQASRIPAVQFWGSNWERRFIVSTLRPDDPPENVEILKQSG